jgi:hypothetical protein
MLSFSTLIIKVKDVFIHPLDSLIFRKLIRFHHFFEANPHPHCKSLHILHNCFYLLHLNQNP